MALHPLLDDWGGYHWLPQIGPRVPLAMVSVLLTWSGGVISSDYCQLVIQINVRTFEGAEKSCEMASESSMIFMINFNRRTNEMGRT